MVIKTSLQLKRLNIGVTALDLEQKEHRGIAQVTKNIIGSQMIPFVMEQKREFRIFKKPKLEIRMRLPLGGLNAFEVIPQVDFMTAIHFSSAQNPDSISWEVPPPSTGSLKRESSRPSNQPSFTRWGRFLQKTTRTFTRILNLRAEQACVSFFLRLYFVLILPQAKKVRKEPFLWAMPFDLSLNK